LASHAAIAAVSRTLRTLLLDRMVMGAQVTLAPPDQEVSGAGDARVNLYLMQVIENANLKNQDLPGKAPSGTFQHPPLSLNLRYMMTTHSQTENQQDSDINAQTLLGDAMRVFNDFGNQIDHLSITNAVAGPIGDPVLDPELSREFERLKVVLHPTTLDDVTKVWSALSGSNFRRSVFYEVTVVQIETPVARVRPAPVERRRIFVTVRKRPEITDGYVSLATPGDPIGETRVRIGDEITIISQGAVADRTYVRLGTLDPVRVPQPVDGRIRIIVPDAQYPPDLDNPLPRPIPPATQLQPGPLNVQVIAVAAAEGVQGALGAGTPVSGSRSLRSNIWLLQLCPSVATVSPPTGNATSLVTVTGTRLWSPNARAVEVIIGDAAIPVRVPTAADPWATPTPTSIQVPVAPATEFISVSATPYPVAVQVDGARSRDAGHTFMLEP
jgi:Pvc16 N-terminal domain